MNEMRSRPGKPSPVKRNGLSRRTTDEDIRSRLLLAKGVLLPESPDKPLFYMCYGKRVHDSRQAAEKMRRLTPNSGSLEVYLCPLGRRHYHVGRAVPTSMAAARQRERWL